MATQNLQQSSMVANSAYRFGPFDLDAAQLELRKDGVRQRLSTSRLRLLGLLVSRAGQLVTREEIAALLWQDALTVDVGNGINTAVNQLRRLLGDESANPRFIETVIGAGYRFIAEVVPIDAASPSVPHPVPGSESHTARLSDAPASTQAEPGWLKRRGARAAWLCAAIAALVSVSVIYLRKVSAIPPRPSFADDWQQSPVTDTGDVGVADISPDGRYVAYVRTTGEGESLWLNQVATGLVVKLASIGADFCPGVAFSPDGTYVYFVRKDPSASTGSLYRIPFLGGNPTRVLSGVTGELAIAPDGRTVAFVRSTLGTHGEDSIVTASISGSDERILITYPPPGIHFDRIAWSYDGRSLIYPLQSQIMTIPATGGSPRALPGPHWWEIDDVRALPECCGIVVVGQLTSSSRRQLFLLSTRDGHVQPLTRDLSNYGIVRLNANASTLLTTQDLVVSSLQIVTPDREQTVRVIIPENQNHMGFGALAWEASGSILFTNDQGILMESDQDGTNVHPLAGNNFWVSDVAAAADGKFLVATRWSGDDRSQIWRFDRAPFAAQPLSAGKHDLQPSISPDGRSVVYSSVEDQQPVLKKVSSEGRAATTLTTYNADHPEISPDGALIACSYVSRANGPASIAIVPITGGPPIKVFSLPQGADPWRLLWTPDGRAVSFIATTNGVGNIWKQPLAGGPPAPVTHFTSDRIFNFRWWRDGRLLLARGTETIDAVLMQPSHAARQ